MGTNPPKQFNHTRTVGNDRNVSLHKAQLLLARFQKTKTTTTHRNQTMKDKNEKEELPMWPTPTVAEAGNIPNQANYGQVGLSNHPAIVGLPKRPKGIKKGKQIESNTPPSQTPKSEEN